MAEENNIHAPILGHNVLLGVLRVSVEAANERRIALTVPRSLAAPASTRSGVLPDVATLAEQGLPGFDISLRYGLAAPAGTPPAVVERLNQALNAALADEAVIKRIRHEGAEPVPMTPEQYAADIDREETRWSAVVKGLGIVGN